MLACRFSSRAWVELSGVSWRGSSRLKPECAGLAATWPLIVVARTAVDSKVSNFMIMFSLI